VGHFILRAIMVPGRTNIELSVPKGAADEIKVLVEHADRLVAILDATTKMEPATAASTVLKPLAQETGIDRVVLRKLFNALQNLSIIAAELEGADAAFERLSGALDKEIAKDWDQKKRPILTALQRYSDNNPIAITIKAERLTYFHEKLYRDGEIITEVRPVYNEAGDSVIEMVILQSLVVTHSFANGQWHRTHVAMDAADVLKLRKACDRAIMKAKTLKATLDRAKLRTEIVRDEDVAH
jgi:hypothetical protein